MMVCTNVSRLMMLRVDCKNSSERAVSSSMDAIVSLEPLDYTT